MNMSRIISIAFNNAVDIDNSWFILAIPFFIRYIFTTLIYIPYISDIIQLIINIVILGLLYKIISHTLAGNDKLIKPDFSIYDADIITYGIKSFIMLLLFIILIAILVGIIGSIGSITNDTMTSVIIILIAAIILAILVSLSGLILVHGINTDSYTDGIKKIPDFITSIGIGNILMFIFVNLIILIVGGILIGFFTFIPFIGSIIGNGIVSAVFTFYFVLASTYMYKEYVFENRSDFVENS